ncbi:non-canonical purine NTP diphosphatase [Persicobacter psychrovividus]|uniref:dITP/XTP pyrophosphatase n=1 Tax=Persicobacter psychrovividus TaxID=387638 RepID=A0ABM7VGF2_9BACT|nr:non-canonical purine NTP pyrophosphatase [Persicobacter psychrovividus]
MIKICFATNNSHKIAEIQAMMPANVEVLSLKAIGCEEELPEDQDTLEGNSLQKATYVFEHYKVACFADDTGLEIEALDGAPGVYSARYAGPQRSSEDNMALVLERLKGKSNRAAQFRTVITLISEDGTNQFEGVAKGEIIETLTGDQGFGYDPIFLPQGYSNTFAQMNKDQKNEISHRGHAVRKLIQFFKDNY